MHRSGGKFLWREPNPFHGTNETDATNGFEQFHRSHFHSSQRSHSSLDRAKVTSRPHATAALAANSFSMTQVSLLPPPCDEFTIIEPSRSATRVSPPGSTKRSSP